MIPLVNEQQESFKKAKNCYICIKRSWYINTLIIKTIAMYVAVYLKCDISKELEFKRAFNCLGENSEKY